MHSFNQSAHLLSKESRNQSLIVCVTGREGAPNFYGWEAVKSFRPNWHSCKSGGAIHETKLRPMSKFIELVKR